jgi:hypothetical protein
MAEHAWAEWKDWQQDIIDLLKTEPDSRTINWYWNNTRNTGKTFLCEYLATTMDVIICDDIMDNAINQVKHAMDEEKIPSIIIMNVSRRCAQCINYEVLEALKNGLMYGGKYAGHLIFPHPHVIVFATCEPDYQAMSKDRWNVNHIY